MSKREKSRYAEMTEKFGRRVVEGIEQAQERQMAVFGRMRELTERATERLPELEVPFAESLPSPQTIVQANFKLAKSVLDAQQRYAIGVLDALLEAPKPPKTSQPGA